MNEGTPKSYITLNGYENLKEELYNLVTKERPELVHMINWAASNGDRSENGDYIYGKRKLREVDKKIHYLTKKLENITAVDYTTHKNSTKVYFGASVEMFRNHFDILKVQIVGQDEINPSLNHISWNSPLARSLIGREVGDEFIFKTPHGMDTIEITEVLYI